MAESKSTVVPLCGSNYPTWKSHDTHEARTVEHCRWLAPAEGAGQDAIDKFACRKDKALALVELSVEPSLLYLLREPDDEAR